MSDHPVKNVKTKGAHGGYMTQLMPSDGKELQRIDEIPHSGHIPYGKYDHHINRDLGWLENAINLGANEGVTYDIEYD
jgi:hypothetical protein